MHPDCPAQEVPDSPRNPSVVEITSNAPGFRELERERRELKPAHEILLAPSSFFVAELDPPLPC